MIVVVVLFFFELVCVVFDVVFFVGWGFWGCWWDSFGEILGRL